MYRLFAQPWEAFLSFSDKLRFNSFSGYIVRNTIYWQLLLTCVMFIPFLQVDIFSFAIFVFELLSGCRPFREYRNIMDIKKAIRRGVRPTLDSWHLDTQLPRLEGLMRWVDFPFIPSCFHFCFIAILVVGTSSCNGLILSFLRLLDRVVIVRVTRERKWRGKKFNGSVFSCMFIFQCRPRGDTLENSSFETVSVHA